LEPIGVPPTFVCDLFQTLESQYNSGYISQGTIAFNQSNTLKVRYNLCYNVTYDYNELRSRAFSVDPNGNNPDLTLIKNSTYTGIYIFNKYYLKLMYFIPGVSTPTSEYSNIY